MHILYQGNFSHLDTEVTPVHIVTQEEVSCRGWRASHLKQFHQVEKLPMDVTAHCIKKEKNRTKKNWIGELDANSLNSLFNIQDIQTLIHGGFIQP